MAQELINTSAPKGLKTGSKGYCTVAYTEGMPSNLLAVLEAYSGYAPVYQVFEEKAALNPVSFCHYRYSAGAMATDIVSRICFSGLDYTKRFNKLAHHIVIEPGEKTVGGPASFIGKFDEFCFFERTWEKAPELLTQQLLQDKIAKVRRAETSFGKASTWKSLAGDEGWAGVLAETYLKNKNKPSFIIFDPEKHKSREILNLIAEALSLLPPEERWNVTFNTYLTSLPQGSKCVWRCCVAGSDTLKDARRTQGVLVIDLTSVPSGKIPEGGILVAAAKTGEDPNTKSYLTSDPAILESSGSTGEPDLNMRSGASQDGGNHKVEEIQRIPSLPSSPDNGSFIPPVVAPVRESGGPRKIELTISQFAAIMFLVLICGGYGFWALNKNNPVAVKVEEPQSPPRVKNTGKIPENKKNGLKNVKSVVKPEYQSEEKKEEPDLTNPVEDEHKEKPQETQISVANPQERPPPPKQKNPDDDKKHGKDTAVVKPPEQKPVEPAETLPPSKDQSETGQNEFWYHWALKVKNADIKDKIELPVPGMKSNVGIELIGEGLDLQDNGSPTPGILTVYGTDELGNPKKRKTAVFSVERPGILCVQITDEAKANAEAQRPLKEKIRELVIDGKKYRTEFSNPPLPDGEGTIKECRVEPKILSDPKMLEEIPVLLVSYKMIDIDTKAGIQPHSINRFKWKIKYNEALLKAATVKAKGTVLCLADLLPEGADTNVNIPEDLLSEYENLKFTRTKLTTKFDDMVSELKKSKINLTDKMDRDNKDMFLITGSYVDSLVNERKEEIKRRPDIGKTNKEELEKLRDSKIIFDEFVNAFIGGTKEYADARKKFVDNLPKSINKFLGKNGGNFSIEIWGPSGSGEEQIYKTIRMRYEEINQ